MIWIGVDPGVSGAIAVIRESGDVETIRFTETWHDIVDWLQDETELRQCKAVLEQVHAMPKQGVSSTFKFGRMYGAAEMLLVAAAIPYETVTPAKWQTAMKCKSQGDKNVTKAAAQRLFPTIKITHATADAILLAELCRRTHSA